MKTPPPSPNDKRLREALWQKGVLATVPEEAFDDRTALAAHIRKAPIALTPLVGNKRQRFKSKTALTASPELVSQPVDSANWNVNYGQEAKP